MHNNNNNNNIDDSAAVASLAARWLRLDRDPVSRAAIAALLARRDFARLRPRLAPPIAFGTAGLRAEMAAGFACINQLTVIQASQGLASYIAKNVPSATERGIVVGHDHRHNSETFARLTAAVFLVYGFKVYFFDSIVHTPMVPFAIQRLHLAGGIMITASHNPKQDNGYKVYWENSCQIIPPHDKGIAAEIEALNETTATWDVTLVDSNPKCIKSETESLKSLYFSTLSASLLSTPRDVLSKSTLRYAYTAMHGVGFEPANRVLRELGLPPFAASVPEQVFPDPDFPTVAFPNPEEKGALDLAIALANGRDIPLVFANDPDADRFAAAERRRRRPGDGGNAEWHVFTGDQIGALLAYAVVRRFANAPAEKRKKVAMINSAWMSNKAVDLQNEGYDTFFVYEEAIGFMTHPCVLDKDGVSALASFAELAISQHANNSTMLDLLEDLYKRYGFHASNNHYFICHNPAIITEIFKYIRFGVGSSSVARTNLKRESDGATLRYPKTVAGFQVSRIRDLTVGFEMSGMDKTDTGTESSQILVKNGEFVPSLPVSSSSEMITFELVNECIFTLRTSGTEPKIKYYIEKKGSDRGLVHKDLELVVKAVAEELFQASKNGLSKL
ncbi:Phosphoglucomutase-3 [Entophlyctis sp. JEL0112]|nr:Phosphoglucomutase-3 [Entophlyctis sp. JEL0112]